MGSVMDPVIRPTLGRIVHFVLDESPNKGECRPAIIVAIEGNAYGNGEDGYNVVVFMDGPHDSRHGESVKVIWREALRFVEQVVPGQLHWPIAH